MNRLLQSSLEPLARDRRRSQQWRELTSCWAAFALGGLLLLLVQRLTGWTSLWTAPLLGAAALATASAIGLRLRRQGPDYRALARRIEAEHADLQALLLTAVEQQPHPATGQLNYLQQRVVTDALGHPRRAAWGNHLAGQAATWRRLHWLTFGVLLLLLGSLGRSAVHPPVWLGARSHGVFVTPGDTSLERGTGLVVLARFRGRLPAEATLVVRPVNASERRLPLTKNLDDPIFGGGLPEVDQDLAYRIEFPGGRTRDFKVTVFDYPRLDHADATLRFPRYTGLATRVIRDTRRVTAIEGTRLDYAFYLNKPVATARLLAPDHPALTLTADTNNATVYHTRLVLERRQAYRLLLVDQAGRTNQVPPQFVFESLSNRRPEVKLLFPPGDSRVSPLEEIAFEAEAADDFGLRAYGIAYALAGEPPHVVPLGGPAGASEPRRFGLLLPLETLKAQPDQLLSYYAWADDVGPDGKRRRTASDMFFAEVRPFDEVFREGQSPPGGAGSGQGASQTPAQKLADLQKQIISATWNLNRRENRPQPSPRYTNDVTVVAQSQQEALRQTRALAKRVANPQARVFAAAAAQAMTRAADRLQEAAGKNSLAPLPPALTCEQSALQALLHLQSREFQVARSRNRPGAGGGSAQPSQRELAQLDLKETENRYETRSQATPLQDPTQHERLQVLSRLKELAQRQQDLNQRLKELQTALSQARTRQQRDTIRHQLKRLREEQQDMLADVDELRQRLDRPENQSAMTQARQELDQTRSQVQHAVQALGQDAVPDALAAGTRAQRQLQQIGDQFRTRSALRFAEQMRQMRNDAQQLAQRQESISRQLGESSRAEQKRLDDSNQRRALAAQLAQQKNGLTNLWEEMRQVSAQSETAQPLLSKQLYDLLRQTSQGDLTQTLELSAELVGRGFLPQAAPFEQRARRDIDQLKLGVDRAAQSVLGDETESLRLAQRELEGLRRELANELAKPSATNLASEHDRLTQTAGPAGSHGGNGGAQSYGPLTGNDFVNWSDRLRDVEELLDAPDLRSEVARVRDRARAVRIEYRRTHRQPDWNRVRSHIAEPLAEVQARVGEALARRESKNALVPIDRDPVPGDFSELVRRYYERLGKPD